MSIVRRDNCSVLGCSNTRKTVKMIRFQPEDKWFEEWVSFCQNPNLSEMKQPVICALHFEKKYFLMGNRRKSLIFSSKPVPTLRRPILPRISSGTSEKKCQGNIVEKRSRAVEESFADLSDYRWPVSEIVFVQNYKNAVIGQPNSQEDNKSAVGQVSSSNAAESGKKSTGIKICDLKKLQGQDTSADFGTSDIYPKEVDSDTTSNHFLLKVSQENVPCIVGQKEWDSKLVKSLISIRKEMDFFFKVNKNKFGNVALWKKVLCKLRQLNPNDQICSNLTLMDCAEKWKDLVKTYEDVLRRSRRECSEGRLQGLLVPWPHFNDIHSWVADSNPKKLHGFNSALTAVTSSSDVTVPSAISKTPDVGEITKISKAPDPLVCNDPDVNAMCTISSSCDSTKSTPMSNPDIASSQISCSNAVHTSLSPQPKKKLCSGLNQEESIQSESGVNSSPIPNKKTGLETKETQLNITSPLPTVEQAAENSVLDVRTDQSEDPVDYHFAMLLTKELEKLHPDSKKKMKQRILLALYE